MTTPQPVDETYEAGTAPEAKQLDALALGGAAAVVSAVVMLLLGLFGALGVYEDAVEMMQQWHLFFEPTLVGTLAGMGEAIVVTYVFVYAFALLYNAFAR